MEGWLMERGIARVYLEVEGDDLAGRDSERKGN